MELGLFFSYMDYCKDNKISPNEKGVKEWQNKYQYSDRRKGI